MGIRRSSPWPSMLSESGVRICSHDLHSIRTALQPMQGCTEEFMELWLVPALVIHFLACSDLITSASADSAGGPAQSGQPEVLHSPHNFLPRTPTSSAPQVRKTATPPGGLLAPLWFRSTASSRAT